MGAYLSSPATETEPSDGQSGALTFGASSMQGWRVSQEDAHLALLEYDMRSDTKVSLFGVFDGHGGAEVAQYTARHLPDFIKSLKLYKDGSHEAALEEAFLAFDKHLTEPQVIEELKALAGTVEESDVEEQANEAILLQEEADMPIDALLAKYGGSKDSGDENVDKKVLSSVPSHLRQEVKPKSPFLRAKKQNQCPEASSSGNDDESVASGMTCSSSDDASLANVGSSSGGHPASTVKSEAILTNGDADIGSTSSGTAQNEVTNDSDTDISSSTSAQKIPKLTNTEDNSESSSPKNGENGITTSSDDNNKVTSPSTLKSKHNVQNNGKLSNPDGDVDGNADTTCSTADHDPSDSSTNKLDLTPASSTKPDKGKRKKVVQKSPEKKPLEEGPAYEAFLKDFEEESDEEEDEDDFDGGNSEDSDDEEAEDEDSSDEEEESDEDDDGPVPANFGDCDEPGKDSGCTAVVALLEGNELFVANAGDSRCVVSRGGEAVDMSVDHKPEDEIERLRIKRAGGQVTQDGRVNGGLNLSRALGDHSYKENFSLPLKEQMISALPDIRKLTVGPHDEFMVIACDGIWNSLTSQQVVDFVRPRYRQENKQLSAVCEELFRECLAPDTMGDGTGCDNMTCIIVTFGTENLKKRSRDDNTVASVVDTSSSEQQAGTVKRPRVDQDSSASVSVSSRVLP